MFQCSSASRKFLNHPDTRTARAPSAFQCSSASRKFLNLARSATTFTTSISFSALQRAENSSTDGVTYPASLPALRFSALQRAENSSTIRERIAKPVPLRFQCSSASRKFLNMLFGVAVAFSVDRFSALQRAENSSIVVGRAADRRPARFSALQRAENSSIAIRGCAAVWVLCVSVLFSEPKIPQSISTPRMSVASRCFSALQRAENSSISSTTAT